MLLQLVLFFAIAAAATTLAILVPGAARRPLWVAAPLGAALLALAGWLVALLSGDPFGGEITGLAGLLVTLGTRILLPRWSWLAAQLFGTVVFASLAYLAYAAGVTYGAGLGALALAASTVLLLIELVALGLSVSYVFEILDVVGVREPAAPGPRERRLPYVALQVPTYNEPVEVVSPTLHSLAAIDYPNLLVQVVDNNTRDPGLWRPLERLCSLLGPRFSFMHLEDWPGYKSGALNEATRRLPPEYQVIGIVDADYEVRPGFLRTCVPYFDDPAVAFVQTPQDYREWEDDRYLRGLFYSYRYFFQITMPARAHRNAIIFAGTMGLIRRRVLEEIGGWNEHIVTEDAEASLRMLGLGYRGVYVPTAWGSGMMPLTFDGLKKQRFRWALGGVQILRRHWRELLPLVPHRLRLSPGQRAHYLLGSLQWFGELLTAGFTVLLLLTAIAISLYHRLPVRQLTGLVLVVPLLFLTSGLARALWAMKATTGCTWGDAVRALRVWFALSWVVALACLRGLLTRETAFLRTPKRREGRASWFSALRSARAETLLAGLAAATAVTMVIRAPNLATGVLGALLLFQAAIYVNAPWAGVAAEGIRLTPTRRAYLRSAQSTGDRPPARGPSLVVPVLIAALAAGALAVFALTSSGPDTPAPAPAGPTFGQRIAPAAPTPPPPAPTAPPSPPPPPPATASAKPPASPSPTFSPAPRPTRRPRAGLP